MIADFWNEIFRFGDEIKAEYGSASPQYLTLRELDRRLQRVYDQHEKLTEEVMDKPIEGKAGELISTIKDLKHLQDDEGDRYMIGHYHFETISEVLQFIIKDRNNMYDKLLDMMDDELMKAVEEPAINLFNRACADFHAELDAGKPGLRKAFKRDLLKGESE